MLSCNLLFFLLCLGAEAVLNFTNPLLTPLSTMALTGSWILKTETLNHFKNTEGSCVLNFTASSIPEKRYYKARVDLYLNSWDSEPFQSFIIRNSTYNTTSYSVTFNDLGLYLSGGSMKRCRFRGHIDLEDQDRHINAVAFIVSKDCNFAYELQLRNNTLAEFEISRVVYSMFVFMSNLGICSVMFRIQRNCRSSTYYCLSMSIDMLYMNQVIDLSLVVWDIYQYFLIPVTQ
jgi:hypothetical protein